jgi:hypothetical protein
MCTAHAVRNACMRLLSGLVYMHALHWGGRMLLQFHARATKSACGMTCMWSAWNYPNVPRVQTSSNACKPKHLPCIQHCCNKMKRLQTPRTHQSSADDHTPAAHVHRRCNVWPCRLGSLPERAPSMLLVVGPAAATAADPRACCSTSASQPASDACKQGEMSQRMQQTCVLARSSTEMPYQGLPTAHADPHPWSRHSPFVSRNLPGSHSRVHHCSTCTACSKQAPCRTSARHARMDTLRLLVYTRMPTRSSLQLIHAAGRA